VKKIFLLGNPNVGKTTLFNRLTGKKAQTANFAGTTFREKKGTASNPDGKQYQIVDLPGMYSHASQKAEERVAWKELEDAMLDEDAIFVQVVDPSAWKNSLAITLELQEKGCFPLVLLNAKKGKEYLPEGFCKKLAEDMGIPSFVKNVEDKDFSILFWSQVDRHEKQLQANPPRLQKDKKKLLAQMDDLWHSTPSFPQKSAWTNAFDAVLLHSFFGVAVFLLFMWIIFQVTFTLGAYPMDWIDMGFSFLQDSLRPLLGTGIFASLIIDGLLTGVGGTVVFLPNLIFLFFFLSLLQESGYLSRSSYLFNALFKKVGIPGKASVHLLMGFGCNVPSVMALRAFENKKEKIITAMMTLFMSCGARLPVYTLLISAFIPSGYQGATLFAIYIFGIFVAFATGYTMNRLRPNTKRSHLLLEMPDLTIPSFSKIFSFVLQKSKIFLFRVGKFIVPASMALWFLFSFPVQAVEENGIESSYGAFVSRAIEPIFSPLGFDWKITAGILSGLAAKEVMVAAFAELYNTTED
jgi:ferrous iron transport protein B